MNCHTSLVTDITSHIVRTVRLQEEVPHPQSTESMSLIFNGGRPTSTLGQDENATRTGALKQSVDENRTVRSAVHTTDHMQQTMVRMRESVRKCQAMALHLSTKVHHTYVLPRVSLGRLELNLCAM